KTLAPGESQTLTIEAPAKNFASFSEEKSAWIIEKGAYGLFIGDVSDFLKTVAILCVEEEVVMEKTTHILPIEEKLDEITPPQEVLDKMSQAWKQVAEKKGLAPIPFAPKPEVRKTYATPEIDEKACEIAQKLTDEELIALVMGEITKGQDNLKDNALVETGIYVPGAAGETTCQLEEKYNLPAISMADGPAGLRLMRHYDVDRASGNIYSESILAAISGGLFSMNQGHENADTYYQYATAIPIGTLLAQSWNPEILEEVGELVGEEMQEFGVTWWLAPGMNIHRNPLCGRNFEYYSEDPLIAGVMAAAITRGVQRLPGIGTTIKHYACNSQEDNRMFSDSLLSERALREIYLRGFEIAVKTSQPMCLMTSYNKINHVPAADNTDLITTVLRGEWNFQGIVMTDWTPTTAGSATSYGCMIAGNDLIMPGHQKDINNIKENLANGNLPREKMVECAARLIRLLMMTNGYEGAIPYGERFI
ncbi:MAG: fibronectin type III-like domain-contianing protein, partial [Solobacterium sp.]|nr:fibronectin type III-like domain-contianing protein [Solobacterium sp.]